MAQPRASAGQPPPALPAAAPRKSQAAGGGSSSSRAGRRGQLALVLALALCALSPQAAASSKPLPQLEGKYEDLEGTELVWQIPGAEVPKGLLLALHGCTHSATDWWPESASCPKCIGLPEEVAITSTALARGYGVLAISSRDRLHRRCWAIPHKPDVHTVDTLAVMSIISVFTEREGLREVPLYALGASSGGAFALTLASHLPLSGVVSQIMALPGDWYRAFLADHSEAHDMDEWQEPPVLFVHMPRDTHTAAKVAESVEIRHTLGLATHVIEVPPQPLTPELLARAPELGPPTGQALIDLLRAHGLVDRRGMLTDNPRSSHWRRIVAGSSIEGVKGWNLAPDVSRLSELLNVAWASHEIVSAPTAAMLDWFESLPVAGAAD